MKLTTNNGELTLPSNFAFTLERTNPFLSEEGDATVPASLPASSQNLKVLDNIGRIDRFQRNLNHTAATLQAGVIVKHGRLIFDSVTRHGTIDVSLAIENSDLYSQYKSKTMKEIFANTSENFQTVTAAANQMQRIYSGLVQPENYTIFPVSIARYENNDTYIDQYNNEVDANGNLIYASRTVHEDSYMMAVPNGYGISPFLYLHRLLHLTFTILGYTIAENCFATGWLAKIVVLNNCSDTIVKGRIDYANLVPSCSLSDFIAWLKEKFNVQLRVDSSSKKVYIRMMETLLTSSPDKDLTSMLLDDYTLKFNDTERVVLSSQTSIDDAEPAASTYGKLLQKYKSYQEVNEKEFMDIVSQAKPAYYDCLILRTATGDFYELVRKMDNGAQVIRRVGSSYFTYDRENSVNTEEHNAQDELPPMHCTNYTVTPYIGERLNFNTTFEGKEETKSEQKIIIVQEFCNITNAARLRGGTTQRYVPVTASPYTYDLQHYLTANGIYADFWHHWNTILLNNKTELSATVNYTLAELLQLDMTTLKMLNNQCLVPKSVSASISDKIANGKSEFIVLKSFEGMSEDREEPHDLPKHLRWTFSSTRQRMITEFESRYPYETQSHNMTIRYELLSYTIEEASDPANTMIYLEPPTASGEVKSFTVGVTIKAQIKMSRIDGTGQISETSTQDFQESYAIIFTAQTY